MKDITDLFELDEATLTYVDGPQAGFLRERATGAWYRFRCVPVEQGWRWTLVGVQGPSSTDDFSLLDWTPERLLFERRGAELVELDPAVEPSQPLPREPGPGQPAVRGLVRAAWRRAARELGLAIELDDVPYGAIALVQQFGGPKGTLVFVWHDHAPAEDWEGARTSGYYHSLLSPDYARYDRALFVDTLADWGYFGPPEARPGWLDEAVPWF